MLSNLLKSKAIELRNQGKSYAEICNTLEVSKSTLSGWLRDIKISVKNRAAIDNRASLVRVEKIRLVKQLKKQTRLSSVRDRVIQDIELSNNHLFIAGFYLYWGEGTKTAPYTVSLTNSDPSIVRCFVEWLLLLGVVPSEVRAKLHVYSDQDDRLLKKYWSEVTGIPLINFNKSYLKQTSVIDKTYKGMFGHGTCVLAYHDRDVHEYVMQGIAYLRTKYKL